MVRPARRRRRPDRPAAYAPRAARLGPAPSRAQPPPRAALAAAAAPQERSGRQSSPGSRPRPARRMGHAPARHAGRAEEDRRRQDLAGRAGAERPPARRACSTISASRARSSTCGPGRSSRSTNSSPRPGIKSSRVIGLADDIARSMSAVSARVAVVQGRNAIGIELPNQRRETVYLRELLASEDFEKLEAPARHRARQDDRRRAGDRRPRPHAASAGRRHHRLGQVGRDQHHDPVARLPPEARAVPADHGRSEDAGALGLRRHPASADARSSPTRRRRSSRSNGRCARWRTATRRCRRSACATSTASTPASPRRAPRARR